MFKSYENGKLGVDIAVDSEKSGVSIAQMSQISPNLYKHIMRLNTWPLRMNETTNKYKVLVHFS